MAVKRSISVLFALLLGVVLCSGYVGATTDDLMELEELPLPRWTEDDAGTFVNPAPEDVLPSQLWPEEAVKDLAVENVGTPQQQNGDNLLFFIPKGGMADNSNKAAMPKKEKPTLREASAEFVRACELAEPDGYLIDPHTALHETQAEDLRRLLSYHAGEAKVGAYFLILGQHETLPSSLDLARLASGRLAQGHTCLVVYPMGEPRRIRFFLSRDISQAVAAKYLGDMMSACVQDSLQASDQVEQLQRFATQLSIRLIWLERAHPAAFAIQKEPVVEVPKGDVKEWYPEVMPEAAAPEASMALWEKWKDHIVLGSWVMSGATLGLAFILYVIRGWRRRSRQAVWIIPEVQFSTRLGGAHCGGGGVSTRYN